MTPPARVQTAIELLDWILNGVAPEKALTMWARHNRYAGSKDRAAIRDLVYDALRRKRSCAALGGGMTGRGLMLGLSREQCLDTSELFTGKGYGPTSLSFKESSLQPVLSRGERLDLPDWLLPHFDASLGMAAEPTALALRHRAPVMLRSNTIKCDRSTALSALSSEQITGRSHALAKTAIEITQGARKITASAAFSSGLVELQDAASQAVIEMIPATDSMRALDYCAGGGGKALALAALGLPTVDVWDVDAGRMKDIAKRAERAGAAINILTQPVGLYDLVLCDVPCSGSGAWRRAPYGKWRLTADRLKNLTRLQFKILHKAAPFVSPNGLLVYSTCSVLAAENMSNISQFTAVSPEWECCYSRQFLLSDGGDGFFTAHLKRADV